MRWKLHSVVLVGAFMLAISGCGTSGASTENDDSGTTEPSSSPGDVAACEWVLEDYAGIQSVLPATTGGAARDLYELANGLPETFQLAISSAQSPELSESLGSASDAATNLSDARYQEAFQFSMEPVVEECADSHDVWLSDLEASLQERQETESLEEDLATQSWDEYPEEYQNINTLKDAFVSTGQECDRWEFDSDGLRHAVLSGSCDPTSVLALYSSSEDVEKQLLLARDSSQIDDDEQWLVGQNWSINADVDLEQVQSLMGGELVALSSD